jgi:Cyclic nucleotide-binding domain
VTLESCPYILLGKQTAPAAPLVSVGTPSLCHFEQISFRRSGSIPSASRGVASPKVRWLRSLPVDGAAEAIVAIHGKGDFFGEGCLTGQPRRLATATAMTERVIMRLDKASVVRVVHEEPEFSNALLAYC